MNGLTQYLRSMKGLGFSLDFNHTGYTVHFNKELISSGGVFIDVYGRPQGRLETMSYNINRALAIKACHHRIMGLLP